MGFFSKIFGGKKREEEERIKEERVKEEERQWQQKMEEERLELEEQERLSKEREEQEQLLRDKILFERQELERELEERRLKDEQERKEKAAEREKHERVKREIEEEAALIKANANQTFAKEPNFNKILDKQEQLDEVPNIDKEVLQKQEREIAAEPELEQPTKYVKPTEQGQPVAQEFISHGTPMEKSFFAEQDHVEQGQPAPVLAKDEVEHPDESTEQPSVKDDSELTLPENDLGLNLPDLGSDDDLGLNLPDLGADDDLGLNLPDLGSDDDLGLNLPDLGSDDDLGLNLPDLGSDDDLGLNLPDLGSDDDLGLNLPDLGSDEDDETNSVDTARTLAQSIKEKRELKAKQLQQDATPEVVEPAPMSEEERRRLEEEEYERMRIEAQRRIEEERLKVFEVQYQEAEEEKLKQAEEDRLAREDEERRRLAEEERIRIEREEQERLEQERVGMFVKLMQGLSKTRDNILNGVEEVLKNFKKIDDELYEELEEVLIMADFGVETSSRILDELKQIVEDRKLVNPEDLKGALQEIITNILLSQESSPIIVEDRPNVVLVIGVNGVGKTTSIGKLSYQLNKRGKKVVIAAADTFRAAAIEQLQIWAERAQVDLIKHAEGSDPASVVFDAITAAKARKADVLICDTAGRLQNKVNLMKELEKIGRIIEREYPEANKEVLIVLDATTGQNAISQVKIFKEVAKVDGIILTKLDGTAKGGAIVGICSSLNVPVKYIGVGETIEDLQVFDAEAFARALFETRMPVVKEADKLDDEEEDLIGDEYLISEDDKISP